MENREKDLLREFDSDYDAMHQLRNGNKRLLSMLLILMAINIFICPLFGIGNSSWMLYTKTVLMLVIGFPVIAAALSVVFTLIPYRDFSYAKKYYRVFLITMLALNSISFVGRTARFIVKLIL